MSEHVHKRHREEVATALADGHQKVANLLDLREQSGGAVPVDKELKAARRATSVTLRAAGLRHLAELNPPLTPHSRITGFDEPEPRPAGRSKKA